MNDYNYMLGESSISLLFYYVDWFSLFYKQRNELCI